MAPIKFEDNIREKLQEREIQPSQDAWNTLQAQLNEKEEKGGNKMLWFAIAASIVTILIVGSLIFNTSETISTSEIVSEEVSSEKPETNANFNTEEILQEAVVFEEQIPEEIVSEKPVKEKIENVQKKQRKQYVETVAVLQKNNTKEQPVKAVVIDREKLFVDSKIDEVVAQVKNIQKINKSITPAEIDALLAKAQLEIQTKRILNAKKVDATALLEDVELELERGFRDKVYDALGDGFQLIRTAVVERNN